MRGNAYNRPICPYEAFTYRIDIPTDYRTQT